MNMLNREGNSRASICKHQLSLDTKPEQNRNRRPVELESRRRRTRLESYLFLSFLSLYLCLIRIPSSKADHITNSSYKISSNKNTEKIGIGNTKTNNYNIHQSNYSPTQVTQVLLNVVKPKKLRKSRAPVEAEFAIKRRIVQLYELAKQELAQALAAKSTTDSPDDNQLNSDALGAERASMHLNHLGRVIEALNPKYIATERVRRVAFADPDDSGALVPLPDHLELPTEMQATEGGLVPDQGASQMLHLDFNETTKLVLDQLDELAARFSAQVSYSPAFIEQLQQTSDHAMTPVQSAFKRLLLCLNDSDQCDMGEKQQEQQIHLRRREMKTEHDADKGQLASELVSKALSDVSHIVGETDNHQIYVKSDAFPTPDLKRGLKETIARAKAAKLNHHSADSVHDQPTESQDGPDTQSASPHPVPKTSAKSSPQRLTNRLNLSAIRTKGIANFKLPKPSILNRNS